MGVLFQQMFLWVVGEGRDKQKILLFRLEDLLSRMVIPSLYCLYLYYLFSLFEIQPLH